GRLLAASTIDEQVESARAQVALGEARVAQSQAALDRALLELEYTKLHAEIAGTIARRAVEPGQMVSPDRPLLAIVDLADTWVIANLKETQLADIKPGQDADIEIDTYSGTLHGKVDSIAAGYMMANIVVIPMTGWFQRRFGFARYFSTSVLVFTGASALCGMAWNLPTLVLFRVLQGMGGGAIIPTAQAILFQRYPREQH